MKRSTAKFKPRVWFNWGFHDATHEASRNMPRRWKHVNAHYAEGYQSGFDHFKAEGTRPESSQAAWDEFKAFTTA